MQITLWCNGIAPNYECMVQVVYWRFCVIFMYYLYTFCGRVFLCSWHSDSFGPFVFRELQQKVKFEYHDWESKIVKETGNENRENSKLWDITLMNYQILRTNNEEMYQGEFTFLAYGWKDLAIFTWSLSCIM